MEVIEITPCSSFFLLSDGSKQCNWMPEKRLGFRIHHPHLPSSEGPLPPFIHLSHNYQIFMECLLFAKLQGLSDLCCSLCLKYTSHILLSWMNSSSAFKYHLKVPFCEGILNSFRKSCFPPAVLWEHHLTVLVQTSSHLFLFICEFQESNGDAFLYFVSFIELSTTLLST